MLLFHWFLVLDHSFQWDISIQTEPVLVRVKRPDDEALTERHLKLKDNDKSGLTLPSEKLNQNQNVPEIKVSLEKVTTGSNGHHLQTPVQTGDYLNSLDPKSLKDKVEEAMFSELCTTQEYVRMKADIMRYHCVRFQEKDCSPTALYGSKCGYYKLYISVVIIIPLRSSSSWSFVSIKTI